MLTLIVFTPVIGAILISLIGQTHQLVRRIALLASLINLVLTLIVCARFSTDTYGFQFIQRHDWIESINVDYFVAVDGLSLPLILLSSLLGLSAVLASWKVQDRVREYFVWLLLLQTAVTGVFVALDFILFFIFWELELLPMFFLISKWGSGRKEYSAMKFLLYTFLGSAFMFAAILTIYLSFPEGDRTFDMTILATRNLTALLIPTQFVFMGFLLAFAVKLPIVPFHTWLPDAHTDAPTAVSVMLAGVLLKMGGYGFLRITLGMFPSESMDFAGLFAIFAVINVIYGAFIVMRQTDLKRLVAYSSISHMGFVLLGFASVGNEGPLTQLGLNGAALQLFSHGLITGLLFITVGLIYDRTHTRHIPDLGGLASKIPIIGICFFIAGLAALGLPSTSGFIAELLILLGSFPVWGWASGIVAFGVVLAAAYILWMAQRTLFGTRPERYNQLKDASLIDTVSMAILLVPIMVVGLYPGILTGILSGGILPILARFG
jgi:NADH-quinone oxidoreductase subunit M